MSENEVNELMVSGMEINVGDSVPEKEKDFVDVLKMFAPGTSLRSGLDDLLRARMGALIVFHNENVNELADGGFRINSKFSSQRLVELCKMDGGIILSKDGKRILSANVLLFPGVDVPTRETGTRHKAAERTAKKAKTIVIAVSERKNKISLYYGDMKYELDHSSEILRRAAETLQILEKQREIYNDLMSNFNIIEINGLVTIDDVASILQRLEIIERVSDIVKRYLIELGKEGMIVSMRLKELTGNLVKEEEIILRDYFGNNYTQKINVLDKMNFDFLLESSNIARMLFEDLHDDTISPAGLRILSRTNLLERYVNSLIAKFKTLDRVLAADNDELLEILGTAEMVEFFNKEINVLKEKIMVGKKI
jgi:diadenylate cyclase